MPTVKERLRRATAMSAPSFAMACRRRSGRTDLFFVSFIRLYKIDLKCLKVYFTIPNGDTIPEFFQIRAMRERKIYAQQTSHEDFLEFVLRRGRLTQIALDAPHYDETILRFCSGQATSFDIAATLRSSAHFSHSTAAYLIEFDWPNKHTSKHSVPQARTKRKAEVIQRRTHTGKSGPRVLRQTTPDALIRPLSSAIIGRYHERVHDRSF